MLTGSVGLSRRNRLFLTTFAVVFVLVYAILAFNAVQFTSVTRKSGLATECKCEEQAQDNEVKHLAGTSSTPASGVNSPVTQQTTPSKAPREGEFLVLEKGKRFLVLEDDFKGSNDTNANSPSAEESKKNETKSKDQKWKHKYYHIVKPDEKSLERKVNPVHRKGIFTRFGYIDLPSLEDHAFLTNKEIMELSKLFLYDYFGSKIGNRSRDSILTYENRTQKYVNLTEESQIVNKPLCPAVPPGLLGKLKQTVFDLTPPSFLDTLAANPDVKIGGRYTPPCHPRSKIAIIVPFRGRESQLQVLLAHMHPIWQRQQIDYTVYTVSQVDDGTTFNKAKLMNVGFLEASKYDTYDCFVFHDVDMTLEDDRCLYRCPDTDNARELSVYLDKFDYQELKYHLNCRPKNYPEWLHAIYFGGVAMMTPKQILDVNGYSNLFWGWGSEDIDMYLRLWKRGYKILNPYGRSCSYHMIKHETESSNKKNEGRFALLANSVNRMRYEGLNSVRYKILSVDRLPLYTNITVEVGQPKISLVRFMTKEYGSFQSQCQAELPWE